MKKSTVAFLVVLLLFAAAFESRSQNMFRKVSDFDGDGKADFAITRAENGVKYWWIRQSSAGLKIFPFGLSTDRDAAGDYDGDGKTDFAVWRYTTNGNSTTFYILDTQTNTIIGKSFGNIPVSQMMHQDYNGDGKTDPAVISGDSGLTLFIGYSGGSSGAAVPLSQGFYGVRTGDMDGDGRADVVEHSFNSPTIIKITDSSTNTVRAYQFGLSTDQFQMADFDGDGKGDLTVWRNSDATWWWLRSSDNVVNATKWGIPGDTPVPADYDGDGKTDLAIWRPGTPAVFWVNGSQDGVTAFAWGTTGDAAVQF